MIQTRKRPATTRGASYKTIAAVDSMLPAANDLPHARAYAAPPCPRRSLWLVVVLTCPWCGTAHQHRAGEAARLLSGRLVKTCPVVGQLYRLAPVHRRREARR